MEPLEVIDRRESSTNPERATMISETSGTIFVNVDVIFRNFEKAT